MEALLALLAYVPIGGRVARAPREAVVVRNGSRYRGGKVKRGATSCERGRVVYTWKSLTRSTRSSVTR